MDNHVGVTSTREQPSARARWGTAVGAVLIFSGLYAVCRHNPLLLHCLAVHV